MILSQMLGVSETELQGAIKKLESLSGYQGIDIRFLESTTNQVRLKTSQLNLDISDTTGQELYYALSAKFRDDNERFMKRITGNNQTTILRTILRQLDETQLLPEIWAVKPSVVKSILRANPPRAILKCFGYRSLDSLLKREPVAKVLSAAKMLEAPSWQKKLLNSESRLKASDFETAKLKILTVASKQSEAIMANARSLRSPIDGVVEVGSIVIFNNQNLKTKEAGLGIVIRILDTISELRIKSSYLKLRQMDESFGQTLIQSVTGPMSTVVQTGQLAISWRQVQYYYGQHLSRFPANFLPHLQAEDVRYQRLEDQLNRLDPKLKWWRLINCAGYLSSDNLPISMNIADVAGNFLNNIPYGKQSCYYLQRAVWDELISRYLAQPGVKEYVLAELEKLSPTNYKNLKKYQLEEAFSIEDKI